ncbi:MAG: hypothetical protein O3C39_03465 [Planctomycetota bacterium]|jgi:hypothetical protein|nr:hypothetical protein [Pirellulales bacterium]MDA0255233.1 hypothetical protein [Planctomycetota bacterium]MDA1200721.1 hypothetical protein [Planctomycetota bacterium]
MPVSSPLVRLLKVLQPSLAMYVAESGIWSYPGPEEIRAGLADLVGDQRGIMDRAVLILEEREVAVPKNAYPIAFSGWHDVDLRHVLPRVVTGLERQLPELELLAATSDDAATAGLAAEALTSTRHHVEALKTIAAKLQAGLSAKPATT